MSKKVWQFPPSIKRFLKIFGITVAIIFTAFGITSWIIFENKNEWLLSEIQSYVEKSQSGQLKIASINLKLFKSFPDITLELDGITYYENHDSLRTDTEKPILKADQLFVALEFYPLLNDELKISEISLTKANLNIIEYANGQLNITKALAAPVKAQPKVDQKKTVPKQVPSSSPPKEKKPKPPAPPKQQTQKGLQLNLESIALSDVTISWALVNDRKPSIVTLEEFEVELSQNENTREVSVSGLCDVQSVRFKSLSIPKGNLTINLDLIFESKSQLLTVRKSEINYNQFSSTLQGTYAHQQNGMLNLDIDASSNDLELLSMFIKPEVIKQNSGLLKQADVYVNGKVFGEIKNHPPQFNISFGLKKLDLHLPKNLGSFGGVGFDGNFESGAAPDYSEAKLEIKNVHGQIAGGLLEGEFSLKNFLDPYLIYNLNADLRLDGYDEVFNISAIKQLKGSISLHANFDGPLKNFKLHSQDSNRSSSITLNKLSFIITKTNQQVSGLSGKIENKNNRATVQQLSFQYGKNDLALDATIDNLMHYLFTRDTVLIALGNIRANQLHTNNFIVDTLSSAHVQDRITNLSFDFKLILTDNDLHTIPTIEFDIQNLTATLDQLPNLKLVNAKGILSKPDSILRLDLQDFHATLPHGKVAIVGDLTIPQRRLWEFNARVNADNLPWTYVQELVAEIRDDKEPVAKNLPVKEMDIVTAEIDLSASIITYPFDFTKLNIRNSKVNFATADTKSISANNINVALENLKFNHPLNSGSITGLKSTKGTISMKQLKVPGLSALDINLGVNGKNDSLNIDFSSASQIAKSEAGKLFMDISTKERVYQLDYTVKGASLEYFVEKFYKKKFMNGSIDYALKLHAAGSSWSILKQNMAGEITISGDSLDLSGVDIDKVLRKFERSQNFNLTDVGAVLIAGPVGLAVTKGTDFVSLATVNLNPKDRTFIKELHTEWTLEKGQLITKDVAFATLQNRLAFNGSIDFVRDSIPGLTIAVIDKNGCSLMDQKLYGKTNNLKTGKLNITKTLFGSVINFVNVIVGNDCKPVYIGTIKHPQ